MLTLSTLLLLMLGGVAAGFLAGLLGIGGGLVMVPLLVAVLGTSQIGVAHLQHIAVATSLATMIFTSLSSVLAHQKRGAVDWYIVKHMALAMVVGTLFGSVLAGWLSGYALRWLFVIYAFVAGCQMLLGKQPAGAKPLPSIGALWAVGSGIGTLSSWVGIGGGSMSVPYLAWRGVPMHRAIGTSAALGWPIAVSGALGYILSGWSVMPDLPRGALGFVYLPAVLSVGVMTIVFAPLGARLSHRLPVKLLKKCFAVLLLVLAADMLRSLMF